MREKTLLFGEQKSLVGVITHPASNSHNKNRPAFIFLNAGLLHRVGPNRLHVKIARKLAEQGFIVLRFDFSGIGDSKANDEDSPFQERAISETRAAMDYLNKSKGIQHFVLIGICSGAVISFKTACIDSRVAGIVPINAPNLQEGALGDELLSHIQARHAMRFYMNVSLFNPSSWLRVFKGKTNYQNIKRIPGLIKNRIARKRKKSSTTNFLVIGIKRLIDRNVNLLFVHSEWDWTLDALNIMLGQELQTLEKFNNFGLQIIKNADHIFTTLASQKNLLEIILNWTRIWQTE